MIEKKKILKIKSIKLKLRLINTKPKLNYVRRLKIKMIKKRKGKKLQI